MMPVNYRSNKIANFDNPVHLDETVMFEAASIDNSESTWLMSFSDMVTLLLTFFVMLLTMHYATALEPAHAQAEIKQHTTNVMTAAVASAIDSSPSPIQLPQAVKDQIEIIQTPDNVNLLIKDDILFEAGSDSLTAAGKAVLDNIADLLGQSELPVSVEGHTDDMPIRTARFPSNWELSSMRATNVTRHFIERGISTHRLRAIGYADTRPIADNLTDAGRARNRRVTLVIHAGHDTSAERGHSDPVQAQH